MQIVYLTARPELFRETLDHTRHFMPFADEVVAVTPARLAARVGAVDDVQVLTDEELTGLGPGELGALDHTSRNYRLRAALVHHDAVADRFVMADDDHRPLQPVAESDLIDERGRLRRFWFTELDSWRRDTTPFDRGLVHALLVLRQQGIDRPLAFASHQPQVVDRLAFAAAADVVESAAARYPLDEWSIHANLGPRFAPEGYAPPEPFTTLGWPRFPGEWPHVVPPAGFWFENHHPELYEPGGLFEGLPTALDPETVEQTNLEKCVRWYRFGLDVLRLDFSGGVDEPFTEGRRSRRAFFAATRPLRKMIEYASLRERDTVADLTGRVRLLEERLDRLEDDDGS